VLHYPSVTISPNVTIGKGVYILLGTSIMPHTVIKDYVMISMNVGLAHHNVLEAGVFLSSGGALMRVFTHTRELTVALLPPL
jgi:hypothetical protein